MQRGELWYMNINLSHTVENRGGSHRVHLVIDCVVNDRLRGNSNGHAIGIPAANPCTKRQILGVNA